MTSELLPCPFCGGPASLNDAEYPNEVYVGCYDTPDCPIESYVHKIDREQAIKDWNTRHDARGGLASPRGEAVAYRIKMQCLKCGAEGTADMEFGLAAAPRGEGKG